MGQQQTVGFEVFEGPHLLLEQAGFVGRIEGQEQAIGFEPVEQVRHAIRHIPVGW